MILPIRQKPGVETKKSMFTYKISPSEEFEFEKRVTPFGTGAKVDCPKEYLGKKVYLVILRHRD